jgi:hypothetical protein
MRPSVILSLNAHMRSQLEELDNEIIAKLAKEIGAEKHRRQIVIDDNIESAFENELSWTRPELIEAKREGLAARAEAQSIMFAQRAIELEKASRATTKDDDTRIEMNALLASWTTRAYALFEEMHADYLRAKEKAKEKGQPVKASPVQFAGGSPWDFDG